MHYKTFLFFLFLSVLSLNFSVEAKEELKKTSTSDRAFQEVKKIEQVSFFPHPSYLVGALRQQDQKPFLSAVLNLMFEKKADGHWKPLSSAEANSWQEEIDRDPLKGCPVEKNTLDKGIAYKPKGEFYLRHSAKFDEGVLTIQAGVEKANLTVKKGCLYFSETCGVPNFTTFQNVKNLKIEGLGTQIISLPLAPDFDPFILLRYQNGEMLPVPARLDTVIYDPDLQRLMLSYRATFLLADPIRKLEYRLLGPQSWVKASATETLQQALTRENAMRTYLEQCPHPLTGWAGEPCADPKANIDFVALGKALGLERVKQAPTSKHRPGQNVTDGLE